MTTAIPKSTLDRKIVVKTRLEVANIIAEADLKNSPAIIIKMLTRKRNAKLKIGFRLRSILFLLVKTSGIKSTGKM